MPPRRIVVALSLSLVGVLIAWLGGRRGGVAAGGVGSRPSQSLVSARGRIPSTPDASASIGMRPGQGSVIHRNARELPQWAIPFGEEFWNCRQLPEAAAQLSKAPRVAFSSFDVGRVMERVSSAFVKDSKSGATFMDGGTYRLEVQNHGLGFFSAGAPREQDADDRSYPGFLFRTISVRQGAEVVFTTAGSDLEWHVLGNTTQTLLDPIRGIVEHHEALEMGVEMTWVLSDRPRGSGDVAIMVEVEGMTGSCVTTSGMHLIDDSGRARARVGATRAVDAQGRVWEVPTLAGIRSIEFRVPEEILGTAEFPLAIDPLVSPEFDVDQPVDGPWPCTRSSASVAAGERNYLVTWAHGRGEATEPAVCAARVSRSGELLDPFGILVSAVAAEQTTCSVAANPGGFLVVWCALRGASTVDWDVYGARIREDGTLIDVPPLPICAAAGTVQSSPAVAGNGDGYLVVWRDSRSTGIYGTLVERDGRVVTTNGMAISTAANEQFLPAVASAGTNYMVVWQDYRKGSSSVFHSDIYGARVNGAGVLLDTNGLALCARTNSQYHPAVAGSGEQFLVVWEDYDVEGNDVQGTRVGQDGVVLDPAGITVGRAYNAQASPVVAGTSTGYVVAWGDGRTSTNHQFASSIYGARVDREGGVHDSAGWPLSHGDRSCGQVAIAARADDALVLWQIWGDDSQPTLTELQALSVTSVSRGEAGAEFPIPRSRNGQITPAVSSLGDGFLVVWADNRYGSTSSLDILGARIGAQGAMLDPAGIPICVAPGRQSEPALAGRGTNCLVAWTDWRNSPSNAFHGDIHGALVDAATGMAPGGPFPICAATNDQSLPAVTATTAGYFVAWQDARSTPATALRYDIYGSRVDAAGGVLDPVGVRICAQTANQATPAVAPAGDGALVVWTDFRNGTASDIYGAHIDGAGGVVETNGIEICKAANNQSTPAVAADGTGALVVWSDTRSGASNADVYGGWVPLSGPAIPTNGFPIVVGTGQQTSPAIASQDGSFVVVWQTAPADLVSAFELSGARVFRGDGSVMPLGFNIDGAAQSLLNPGVAVAKLGAALIVSQGAPHDVARTAAWWSDAAKAARMDPGAWDSDGHFGFRLSGVAGLRYQVEISEDLRVWTPRDSFVLTNSGDLFIDVSSRRASNRFYRVTLVP